jgi:hypothetical protein
MNVKEMDRRLKQLFGAAPVWSRGRYAKVGKHAKTCRCYTCMDDKLKSYEARARMAVAGGARPENMMQTIPVRAHWRRGINHLKNDPEFRKLIQEIVRGIMKKNFKM